MELYEVIMGIALGNIKDGDVVKTDTDTLKYIDGTLVYVTEKGYISEPVVINEETMAKEYVVDEDKEDFLFHEAIRVVNDGQAVLAPFYSELPIKDLNDLADFVEWAHSCNYSLDTINFVKAEDVEEPKEKRGQKITEEQAKDIYVQRHMGVPVSSLANEYGITERMVYYILDGTYWSNVHQTMVKDMAKGAK